MDKVRGGEAGNRLRGQPGLPGTGREGGLGYVRRDCISLAQSLATCMGAKAAQYLASGHAVKHPCALILDIPVS